MPLFPGTRVGQYEIVAPLGSGGMGEVYRARDTRLKREVALKVLPANVAEDRERLARFQREAEVLASLNHPHIAHVYGVEGDALVMELVEGEDLSQRIARGPIPLNEVLPLAKQIAEALEAAHESGIVHRDLKPANIKIRDDGTVKVLDFGLAKGSAITDQTSGDLANSPTITSPAMTMQGVILGTAAYMSPEQAKGKAVDQRADIWAFGCVLYEMLTGSRAFGGDDVTDIITSVMRDTPDANALPPTTPLAIRTLLRRCLEKDPRKRVPHMAIARLAIEDASVTTGEPVDLQSRPPSARRWIWLTVAAVLIIAAAGLGYWVATLRPVAPVGPPSQSALLLPHNLFPRAPSQRFAISPDGRRLAYVGLSGKVVQLYVRPLEGDAAQAFPGTEGAVSPFWSPDSRSIAFFANNDLKRVDAAGGPPVTIVRNAGSGRFHPGSWNLDDVILYGRDDVIARVSARGGEPQPVTTIDKTRETGHDIPVFLPDGRHFLYGAFKANTPIGVFRTSLDGGPPTQIVEGSGQVAYASGFLLFTRGSYLMAQEFDVNRGRLTGDAMTVAEDVQSNIAVRIASAFSVSRTGSIVYQSNANTVLREERLTWITRAGVPTPVPTETGHHRSLELSPDGRRAALTLLDDGVRSDAWILTLDRGQRTRLTFDLKATAVLWSPDGSMVLIDNNDDSLLLKNADGSGVERRIEVPIGAERAFSWSPDGKSLLYEYSPEGRAGSDLWIVTIDGSREPRPVVATRASERWGQFSPDGRWIAYSSDESGEAEVYVTRADGSGRWQVSSGGGSFPRWNRNGRELFFYSPGPVAHIAVAPLTLRDDAVDVGAITPLFPVTAPLGFGRNFYDVSPDGRFLVATPTEVNTGAELTLLTNWTQLLERAR